MKFNALKKAGKGKVEETKDDTGSKDKALNLIIRQGNQVAAKKLVVPTDAKLASSIKKKEEKEAVTDVLFLTSTHVFV